MQCCYTTYSIGSCNTSSATQKIRLPQQTVRQCPEIDSVTRVGVFFFFFLMLISRPPTWTYNKQKILRVGGRRRRSQAEHQRTVLTSERPSNRAKRTGSSNGQQRKIIWKEQEALPTGDQRSEVGHSVACRTASAFPVQSSINALSPFSFILGAACAAGRLMCKLVVAKRGSYSWLKSYNSAVGSEREREGEFVRTHFAHLSGPMS